MNVFLDALQGDRELVADGIFGDAELLSDLAAAIAFLAAEGEYFMPLRGQPVDGLADEVVQFLGVKGLFGCRSLRFGVRADAVEDLLFQAAAAELVEGLVGDDPIYIGAGIFDVGEGVAAEPYLEECLLDEFGSDQLRARDAVGEGVETGAKRWKMVSKAASSPLAMRVKSSRSDTCMSCFAKRRKG